MNDVSEPKTLSQWDEVKTLVEMLDKDMEKNAKGNVASGIRIRKGLRFLRKLCRELTQASVENDKTRTDQRKVARKSTVAKAESDGTAK
jgi:hypothetical protein